MYDCIIVGSGPAGGTSAYHLAKQGHSVLLLDKAKLPRYKPCGGGVSPIIQEWFDFDFSPVISLKSKTIYCTWEQEEAIAVDMGDSPIWMVRREVFDYFLVQKAVQQGAVLKDETEVVGLEFKQDCWRVQTDAHQEFWGRYLIAADGAKGNMAKCLGFTKQKKTVVGALELEIPSPNPSNHDTYFEFGLVKHGYAWNFPKADGFSLGAGCFQHKPQSFKRIIDNYASLFNLSLDSACKHGHPFSLWNGPQTLHTDNAVLAGESACIVDPFTAEGIRPSIFSGIKAAEAIHQALSGDLFALTKYTEIMTQEWGKEMKWAKRLSQVFYRFPRLSYDLMVKYHPRAAHLMTQVFTGKLRYSEVAERGINLLLRACTKF
jgi:geranylgeranyl reductase family protein